MRGDDTTPVNPGRVLGGRYALIARIAKGGMAEVWEGHDDVLSRPVAVKILQAHLAADGVFLERFRREAVTAARLAHPAVVATYDTGIDGGTAYIVMELVRGRNLRELLSQEGRLQPWQAVAVARQIADALVSAHSAGLVHRDIKPANVLLVEDGGGGTRVKVTDFGIAKAGVRTGGDLTRTGTVLGTPKYLSPEQIRGVDPDQRADLYAVGVVLYEMLVGTPPFSGDTDMATALAHLNQDVPRPSCALPGLSGDLDALVYDLLAKDPERRVQSAAELRYRLDALGPLAPPLHAPLAPERSAVRSPQAEATSPAEPGGYAGRSASVGTVVGAERAWPATAAGARGPALTDGRAAGGPAAAGGPIAAVGPVAAGRRVPSAGPVTAGGAVPTDGPFPASTQPPHGGQAASRDRTSTGQLAGRRRQRRDRRAVGAVVLALVMAGFASGAAVVVSGRDGHSRRSGQSAAVSRALPIASVSVFMDDARPPDDPAETPFTYDGNPVTAWWTDRYATPSFGGLYGGIGLAIELKAPGTVHSLAVSSPSEGWSAEAFTSLTPVASGQPVGAWGPAASTRSDVGGGATFSLGGRRARYVLLWLTNLGPADRAAVAELKIS